MALKRSGSLSASERIPGWLEDPDEDVRLAAIKWIADEKLEIYRPLLERQLARPDLDTRLFLAAMAALDYLDGKKPTDIPAPANLLRVARDKQASPSLRAMALRLVPPTRKHLTIDLLKALLAEDHPALRLEAIRSLGALPDNGRGPLLAAIAYDPAQPEIHRAEAVAGIALLAEQFPALLGELTEGPSAVLRDEARRALIGVAGPARTAVSGSSPAATRLLEPKPVPSDLAAWETLLGEEPGDPATGRRIFFHSKIGTCSRCHRMEGRGIRVGPDLTTIWKRAGGDDPAELRRWLLESALQPNAIVAPQFLPWEITMKDGAAHIGLPLRKGGNRESYLGLDGREFSLPKPGIASHRELPVSVMPPGLLEQLTVSEVRDLLAYLMAEK